MCNGFSRVQAREKSSQALGRQRMPEYFPECLHRGRAGGMGPRKYNGDDYVLFHIWEGRECMGV